MNRKSIILILAYLLFVLSANTQNKEEKIEMDSVSVDIATNSQTFISWKVNDTSGITRVIIYKYNNTTFNSIRFDSVPISINHYTVNVDSLSPSEQSRSFRIASNDSTGPAPFSDVHSTIFLEEKFDSCNASVELSWNSYNNWSGGVKRYKVYSILNEDTTLEGQILNGSLKFTISNLIADTTYSFFIRVISNRGSSSTSNRVDLITEMPVPPSVLEGNYVSVIQDSEMEVSFKTDPSADLKSYKLLRSDYYTQAYDTLIVLDNSYVSDSIIKYSDQVDYIDQKYYYYLIATNTCNIDIKQSDTISNILLSGIDTSYSDNGKMVITNIISWKPSVPNVNESYTIYRMTKGVAAEIIESSFSSNTYTDNVSAFTLNSSDGKFCYYIVAKRNNSDFSFVSNTNCEVQPPIVYLPNVFTPNGDGKNDTFSPVISFASDYNYLLVIYDRWGEKLFECHPDNSKSCDGPKSWDGTSNGKKVKPGIYVYYLNYSNADKRLIEKTGTVTVYYP